MGEVFARKLFRTHLLLVAASFAILLSWITGVLNVIDVTIVIIGLVNALLALVMVVSLVAWASGLARRRSEIVRSLGAQGLSVSRRPAILTPKRFSDWLEQQGIQRPLIVRVLSGSSR
ncbi:hypothetical protein [Leifsonia aquatica]|uniref:hypothetical protein n=1 Tax=Leifsonia aquatica TaxID=144185 RepID=UPI0038223459